MVFDSRYTGMYAGVLSTILLRFTVGLFITFPAFTARLSAYKFCR